MCVCVLVSLCVREREKKGGREGQSLKEIRISQVKA